MSSVILSLITLIFILVKIESQVSPFFYLSNETFKVMEDCQLKGENGVKKFDDCEPASNYTNNQVCCLIYGTNSDGTNYRGCIAMHIPMFANRTLKYESDVISGVVVCDKNFNKAHYYNKYFTFFSYLLLASILF